jgi:hypothetical protein
LLLISSATLLILVFGLFIGLLEIKKNFSNFVLPKIKNIIKKETGQNLNFESVNISFSKLARLSPAITVKKISIGQSLTIDEIILIINLKSLIHKNIQLKKIIINKLFVTLEENEKREVKLKNLKFKEVKNKKINIFDIINNLSIDEFIIQKSSVDFFPYKTKNAINLNNINLKLLDLNFNKNKSQTSNYDFFCNLFESRSFIKSQGKIGPIDFEKQNYPINGNEELVIYLQEIPNQIKKQSFPKELLLEKNSSIKQSSVLSGNLLSTINGRGNIEIDKIYLALNSQEKLLIKSNIYHSFDLTPARGVLNLNLNTNSFLLKIKDKTFGDLKFKAQVSNNFHNQFSQFYAVGSFNGLEIRDLLNSFFRYKNLLSGTFSINNFEVSSSGYSPAELSKNFKAQSMITIKNGSLYILKSLTRYQNLIDQIFANMENFTEKISGEFIDLKSQIIVANQEMHLKDILINVAPIKIYADGYIKKLATIEFKADLLINKSKTKIPLILSGTLEKPKIKPDFKSLAVNKTDDLVNSLIELGLNSLNKKNKNKNEPEKSIENIEQKTIINSKNGTMMESQPSKAERNKALINSLIKVGLEAIEQSKKQAPESIKAPQ